MRDRGIYLGSFALFLLQVASQSSNVSTCTPLYAWSLNSKNQTPCLVAAFLETVCEPPVEVNTIPPDTHYAGPSLSDATLCRCSTVTYSLISACAGCQNRISIPWTEWATNCSRVEVGQVLQTIPPAVVIPTWAYLDVTKMNNMFNPILANQSLSSSSSSASASATSSTSVPSALPSTNVTLPSITPPPALHKKSNAGAIAGGVVGALIFVVAVGLAVLFCLRRRNSPSKEFERFPPSSFSTSPPPTIQAHGSPRTGTSPLSVTPFPYVELSAKQQHEVETLPGSPVTSVVRTTFDTPSIGTQSAVQILHRYPESAEL